MQTRYWQAKIATHLPAINLFQAAKLEEKFPRPINVLHSSTQPPQKWANNYGNPVPKRKAVYPNSSVETLGLLSSRQNMQYNQNFGGGSAPLSPLCRSEPRRYWTKGDEFPSSNLPSNAWKSRDLKIRITRSIARRSCLS